ncbi:MAG: cobalamin biosynthesis bifunctional protein CbiET, partial [Pseudomonadota bacterium]
GGGLSAALLDTLRTLPKGTRIVANAVTLESESRLTHAKAEQCGALLRLALSEATPIGSKTAWSAAYPIVQWSHTL